MSRLRYSLEFLKAIACFVVVSLPGFVFCDCAYGQTSPAEAQNGTIHGIVKSSNMPIPGATVVITPESSPSGSAASGSEQTIKTWTDVDGSYSAAVPDYGTYTVRVEMTAFANTTRKVTVDAAHPNEQANFELILFSRTQKTTPEPRRAYGSAGGQRGFQSLQAMQSMNADSGANSMADIVPSGMPVPGIDPNGATESIAVSGNTTNPFNSMSGPELEQRINDARQQGGGFGAPGG
ncbi:MAG TPA: carboxypeptidase-like regulatory domain-containing protein, partial [Candidatus Aquilonibacter sp.]|nr:carboxypeptidase-like regulatory domain-containing protein [Candidatus Aquilonibacter sp.]